MYLNGKKIFSRLNSKITLPKIIGNGEVKLTYSLGEYGTGSVPDPVTVEAGENVNINFTTHPTRADYDFIGWATTDGASVAEYEEDGTIFISMNRDVTLYPVFEESGGGGGGGTEVTLTFSLGEYGTGGGIPSPITVNKGESITIPTVMIPPSCTDPTKTYYGWAANTDGASVAYYQGGEQIVMNKDTTLFPVFLSSPCWLTYSGRNNEQPFGVVETVIAESGSVVNVQFTVHPTKQGYDFIGWTTNAGMSTGTPEYSESGTRTITLTSTIGLYAVWDH